ncbi:MAG: DUF6776 family protein [Halioglobus sp.]
MQSQQYRTVVERRHVRRREIQIVVATLLLATALGAGFYLGQSATYNGLGIVPDVYRQMEVDIPVALGKINELEHELEVRQTRNEVDRAALEMVRKELAGQETKILDLEEQLRFYQSLMAPQDIARGLVLRPVEIVATDTAGRFAFRLVAQQEARKHALLKGSLAVKIIGSAEGEEISFVLSALSEDVEKESILLRFRYFQAIEGELILPPGFAPQSVELVGRSTSPSKTEVRELFPWAVQKRFSYVGK